MQFEKCFKSLLVIAALMLIITSPLHATPIDPNADPFGYFNVYSLNDITYSASDFQGKAGAAGDVSLVNFSLGIFDSGNYVSHGGKKVTLGSGSYYGGIEASTDVNLDDATIKRDVLAGGNVNNTAGGTVEGDVNAAGNVNLTIAYNVWGSKNSGIIYSPIAYHSLISNYFTNFSTTIGAMGDTGTISDNGSGLLSVTVQSGINVFSIDAATLKNAHTFNVTGPSDSVVYINIETPTGSANLDFTTWNYWGGILSSNVLVNYYQADSLTYSNGGIFNLLAPFADTSYSGGIHTGNLIVGNLSGTGQVNLGHFSAPSREGIPSPVPEPATMLLFGTGLIGLATRLKRKSQKKNH